MLGVFLWVCLVQSTTEANMVFSLCRYGAETEKPDQSVLNNASESEPEIFYQITQLIGSF